MIGGVVGQLFIIFGLKHNKAQFREATQALHTLRAAAAVSGIASMAQGIVHLATEAAESATHIRSMSQAMGISMAATQRWSFVAEQSGSNIKELSVGVSMLQGNLRKLANNEASPRLQRMFAEMGVTRKDAIQARDNIDGVNAALLHMSASLQKMGVGGKAAADMRALVGARAGRALTADLMRGPEQIKEMFAAIEARGGIISDKSINNLSLIFSAINNVKRTWSGVTGEIIGSLAPDISRLFDKITLWIGENKDLIGSVLAGAFKAVSVAVEGLMEAIGAVGEAFRRAFAGDIKMQTVLITIAGLIVALLIPAVVSLGLAIWAALAPLLIPTAIVAALVFIVLAVRKNWDEIVAAIKQAIDVVVDFFVWLLKLIGKALWQVVLALHAIGDVIIAIFRRAGQWVIAQSDRIVDAYRRARTFFVDLGNSIWNALGGVWDKIIAKARAAYDFLANGYRKIRALFGRVGDFFTGNEPLKDAVDQAAAANASARNAATAAGGPQPAEARAVTANAPPGSAAALAADRGARGPTSVSVGPTTITINGVKNAVEAKDAIADSIEGAHRNALHGFGGEVD